jgi:hypothetical protein
MLSGKTCQAKTGLGKLQAQTWGVHGRKDTSGTPPNRQDSQTYFDREAMLAVYAGAADRWHPHLNVSIPRCNVLGKRKQFPFATSFF